MMNGEIWVESQEGVGSTFHFTAVFGKQQGVVSRLLSEQTSPLSALKVLVVDDNSSAREILSSMLNSFGLQVEQSDNGQSALEKIQQASETEPYQLVLMDWKMPGMDGIETTRILQSDSHMSEVPTVIMVTAYGREEAGEAAADVNISGFLTKPITLSSIHDGIMAAMGHEVVKDTRSGNRQEECEDAISHLRGAKILLVEDNELNQELAQELLLNNGLLVEVANDGQQALELLDKKDFDGVLMDCQMPVMDGYKATQKLRLQQRFKDLPVLAMTANAMAGDREKVLEAGMNDHIAKPINVRDMFTIMAKWITPSEPVDKLPELDIKTVSEIIEIPPLTGININAGLTTCQGNRKLYKKLLLKFRDSYADFSEMFIAALFIDAQQGDSTNEATRCAHSLKGVAGNIGAKEIQKSAESLELACKENKDSDDIERLKDNVVNALSLLMSDLNSFAESIKESSQISDTITAKLDQEKFQSLILQLRELLEDDDTDSSGVIESLENLPGSGLYKNELKQLSKLIADYEFEEALEILKQFKV
jgi:CheY-like chemotaxis protein/HPt (histidine-containing phosphotransfer) domain-containing protein